MRARSSRFLLFCLLFAACSAQTTGGDIGDACDVESPCGEGGVCSVTHTADGSGECLPSGEDLDGDGLPNATDYCNEGEGGAYDEDRDLIGDDCDRCPIAAPPLSPDPDGDDVDAPCDPDSRTPGDRIVLFDGFRGGVPTAFAKTGTWEHLGGGEVIGSPGGVAFATLTAALPFSSGQIAVLVQYRVDEVLAGGRSFAGLVARDLRPASNVTARCGSSRATGGDSLTIEADGRVGVQPVTNAFNTSSLYSVALRIEGVTAGCAMIADATQVATSVTTNGDALTEAGVFVEGVKARFTYLLAIQRTQITTAD